MNQEWFENPNWWFNATPEIDEYITNKYEHLLCDASIISYNPLNLILIYDQLPRHIFRNQYANHIITFYLNKALEIEIDYEVLTVEELCFALLPLRHSNIPDNIYKAIEICWKRLKQTYDMQLVKFLRASYQRCPVVSFTKPIINNPKVRAVLSLSGGVDSMVCSDLYKIDAAIHINYNNRPESTKELEFIQKWCDQKNIPLYVRTIHEINREPCMKYGLRSIYESYTRSIRYHCYKQFGPDAIIILGHNKDDILENIFTNIAHKNKYENLDGMTEYSIQDDIRFWRPLLYKTKSDIYDIAKNNNISHLPCSTPEWSQRGQIRNKIVPVLNSWDSRFTDSIYELSKHLRDMHKHLEYTVDSIIKHSIIKVKTIELNLEVEYDTEIFWRCLFKKLNISVSTKSLDNMLTKLKTQQKIVLNKKTMMEIFDRIIVRLYIE